MTTQPPKAPSPARLAANRANAQKSTGPRSDEGKAVSRMNALTHGLTAKDVVLPTENAEAFEQRKAAWLEHYRPSGPAEQLTVERAVLASWRLDRCARAEAARIAQRLRHAEADARRAALDRAEEIGRRLVFEPVDRLVMFNPRDEVLRERFDRREQYHPDALSRELQGFAAGVDWLLARWDELACSLNTFGHWHPAEKIRAVRLLGRRPEDALDDPAVRSIFLACFAAHPEPWDLYDELAQALRGAPGRGIDDLRVNALRQCVPGTPEAALDVLRAVVAREVARLRGFKEGGLDERAELDLAAAADAAQFDDSPSAVLLRRYETACERELRRAISAAGSAPPAPEPEPQTEPAPEPAPAKNEPKSDDADTPPAPLETVEEPVVARPRVDTAFPIPMPALRVGPPGGP